MHRRTRWMILSLILTAFLATGCGGAAKDSGTKAQAARRVVAASRGLLAPVYAPLAEQIVRDFHLADAHGVGIDVGSGPGTLIIELCQRTKMHWINADINPEVFPAFFSLAEKAGVSGRVSAIRADARYLPFRDDYADVIVSRGSFPFWGDAEAKKRGFAEIYRVLKPGGVAYIGRGFSRDLPVETARAIRAKQGKKMQYDRQKAADELRGFMKDLGIRDFRVEVPQPPGADGLNYGVWVEFHKPKSAGA